MDFDFLKDSNTRHVATFPFSSVGSRLGDELPLDVESLYQRIVLRRRGGELVAVGTPEQIFEVKGTYAGEFLKGYLGE